MKFWKLASAAIYFVLSISLLTACGGSGDTVDETTGTGSDIHTGVFLDSAVQGLKYVTDTLTGTTDADGTFSYEQGLSITFKVGDIVIGTANGQEVMTPVTLVSGAADETDSTVTNIVRFLMTIDDDNDPTNGIQITTAVHLAAAAQSLDFSLSNTEFDASSNVQNIIALLTPETTFGLRLLVSVQSAQDHFSATLASLIGSQDVVTGDVDIIFSGADTTTTGTNFVQVDEVDFGPVIQVLLDSNDQSSTNAQLILDRTNENVVTKIKLLIFHAIAIGSSQLFSYEISCLEGNTTECDKIDIVNNSANFNNVTLPVVDILDLDGFTNVATAPITFSGTVKW